jgi:hypothetical protein
LTKGTDPSSTPALHPSELIRRRLAEWYVESGLEPPAALEKVAELVLATLPHGPVNVWRHADDGIRVSLDRKSIIDGSRDPNEERVATFRRAKKRARRR